MVETLEREEPESLEELMVKLQVRWLSAILRTQTSTSWPS
jgi:hypothetical protein